MNHWKLTAMFFMLLSACMLYYSYYQGKADIEDYNSLMNITEILSNISVKCYSDYRNLTVENSMLYDSLNSCGINSAVNYSLCWNELLDTRTLLNQCTASQPEFLSVASDVANYKPYSYPDWACYQMSMMLIGKLNNMGYDAEIRTGYHCSGLNCSRHSWVMLNDVPIEATKGVVISPDDYKSYHRE